MQERVSQIDAIFANGSYPIEFLFYFKNKIPTAKIRTALKILSDYFWPVFGNYRSGHIHFDGFNENNFMTENIIEEDFRYSAEMLELHKEYSTINSEPMKSLFFMTIIQFNNGTVLIPKLNHLAGDGYSYFYFLSTLASMVKFSESAVKKKAILAMYRPRHTRNPLKPFLLDIEILPQVIDPGNLTIHVEEINKNKIKQMIKEVANQNDIRISINDVLSALAIKQLTTASTGPFGQSVQLTIPIDVRSHIKEFGVKFFGNGIMFAEVVLNVNDVFELSVEDIACKIRQAMPAVSDASYREYLNHWENIINQKQTELLRPYDPQKGCLVTNLSKMPSDKLDFGGGPADLILLLTVGKNSTAILGTKDSFILRLAH